MAAVAPAGRLLFVHHVMDAASAAEHGFRLEEWVRPEDMVAQLGEGLTVEVDDVRPREVSTGAGAHHREDVVLMARRPA